MDNNCNRMIVMGYVLLYRKHNTKKIIKTNNHHDSPQINTLAIQYYLCSNTNRIGLNGCMLTKLKVIKAIPLNLININAVDSNVNCVCKAQNIAVIQSCYDMRCAYSCFMEFVCCLCVDDSLFMCITKVILVLNVLHVWWTCLLNVVTKI